MVKNRVPSPSVLLSSLGTCTVQPILCAFPDSVHHISVERVLVTSNRPLCWRMGDSFELETLAIEMPL